MPTFNEVRQSLAAAGEPHNTINLGHGVRLIATQRGARLLGPFLSDDAPALFWLNPALRNAADLQAFIGDGEWNLGGERMWIAPEIQFNITDRSDFWGTHSIPPALDPGHYNMVTVGDTVHFRQQIALDGYNTASGTIMLDIARMVTPVNNPLQSVGDAVVLMNGVIYAGYAQQAALTVLGGDPMYAEMWNLVQLNAGGLLVIPASEGAEVSPYFGEPRPDALALTDGAFRIELTGQQQYKTGYKATYLSGRMGYLNQQDGTHYLLVRHFNNDPSAVYAEEPPDSPGVRGHAVHVYNDGGQFGANGEMEANGRTIGGDTGSMSVTDTFNMWMYFSDDPALLRRIGSLLLGVAL